MNNMMFAWLAVLSVFVMHGYLYVAAVDLGKPFYCGYYMDKDHLIFTPFFTSTPVVYATLPCRYKLAHFQCGDTRVEAIGDVQRHAYYSYDLPHILRGVSLNITVDGNSAVYSITNDTLKRYLDAGNFSKDPWQKVDRVAVDSYFLERSKAAIIERGGLTIQYLWRRELARDWYRGIVTGSPGLIFSIICNSTFNTYEGFPNTTCGHAEFDVTKLLTVGDSLEDFHVDLHHVYYRNEHYGNYAMLAYHSVTQTNPRCEEASTIARGTCEGISRYWRRGDIFYECGLLYRANLKCAQKTGVDAMKGYVACLNVLCAAEGQATSADTCSSLKQVVTKCSLNGFHRQNSDILALSTCLLTAHATATEPAWPPYFEAPKCSVLDRSVSSSSNHVRTGIPAQIKFFSAPYYDVMRELDVPCNYKVADIQCGGARIVVEVDYATDIEGFAVPNDVRVDVITKNQEGNVTSKRIDISHRDLEKLMGYSHLDNVSSWVADVLANSDSTMTSDGVQLSYDVTRHLVTLLREQLNITFSHIDLSDPSRPNQAEVLSIFCNASDFSTTPLPDSLCGGNGDPYQFDAFALASNRLDPHHYDIGIDAMTLVKQDRHQKDDSCIKANDVLSLGQEGCKDFGNSLYECQYLTSVKHYYGGCMLTNKLDRLQVLTSCMHVQCGTAEARTPKTCSILRTLAYACGASPPADATLLLENQGVHLQVASLLSRVGCNL